MNSEYHSNRIEVQTHESFEYVDITEMIRSEVKKSEMANGIVLVNVLHTTAAVVIQEADLTVHKDAMRILEQLIPCNGSYEHSYEGTVNGSAHQRQQMLGNSCVLPVKDGILVLGTWQRVFLVELFRPMIRHVQITMLGCLQKEESQ